MEPACEYSVWWARVALQVSTTALQGRPESAAFKPQTWVDPGVCQYHSSRAGPEFQNCVPVLVLARVHLCVHVCTQLRSGKASVQTLKTRTRLWGCGCG